MIISNLVGGLGNQMFQYACGRAVSLRTRQPLRLATDQFSLYRQHNGLELLRVFEISVQQASQEDLVSLLGMQARPRLRRILARPSMSWVTCSKWYNEPHLDYWAGIREIDHSSYIHGYWQSEQYFADFADVIRNDFTYRSDWDALDLAVRERMASAPSASLHVRRGDYLKGKFKNIYAACDVAYYISAVRILREKYHGLNLFAFSDEPEWVEKYLEPELGRIEVVSHNIGPRSANDMRLMSSADHNIIANSSFSWWGAWLNPNIAKTVIAPKTWFSDQRPTPTLIPSTWIRL